MVAEAPLEVTSKDYPLTTVFKAKAAYISQGRTPSSIANELGISVDTVSFWAKYYGWTKTRTELISQSCATESVTQAVKLELESASLRSAALVGKTLGLAESAADAGNIRNVMFAASAAKTLADLASKHSGNDSASATAVNVSFSLDGLYRPEPRNVTPDTPALPA
jgi:transposase-like protein